MDPKSAIHRGDGNPYPDRLGTGRFYNCGL